MAVVKFVLNDTDRSTDQGYPFRFRCDHCGNGYEWTYHANKMASPTTCGASAGTGKFRAECGVRPRG